MICLEFVFVKCTRQVRVNFMLSIQFKHFLPLSHRYFPKSSKASALFLCKLWSDKDLQSFLKRVSAKICHVWVCPPIILP